MTKKKLTELTELTTANNADLIHILDVDDPVITNQNKKITVQNLLKDISVNTEPVILKELSEDTTFYVDKNNGSNTNDGLTTSTAWQTIQYAFDEIGQTNLNGFKVALEIFPDTYVDEGELHLPALVAPCAVTCIDIGGPGIPEATNTQFDIGPYGFQNEQPQLGLILPSLEIDHFGYYSINNATIQYKGPGTFNF